LIALGGGGTVPGLYRRRRKEDEMPDIVARCVRNMLAETGCANRTEAAPCAICHGLARE